jgi:hypothetical protein
VFRFGRGLGEFALGFGGDVVFVEAELGVARTAAEIEHVLAVGLGQHVAGEAERIIAGLGELLETGAGGERRCGGSGGAEGRTKTQRCRDHATSCHANLF